MQNVDGTNNTLLLQVDLSLESILVSTTEPINTVHQGDIVEAYGHFTSQNQMIAEKLLIYAQGNYDLLFVRSLLGVPIPVYLFFRSYRFNPDTRHFERRQNHA